MNNNLTEMVFILDKSGSMSGMEGDTIGGFNSMIAKQKKEDGNAFVSTILFNNRSEVLHDRVKLSEVKKLTEEDYSVGGGTALMQYTILRIYISTQEKRMYQRIQFLSSQLMEWKIQVLNIQAMKLKS